MTDHRNWAFATAGIIVGLALWQWTRRRHDAQPGIFLAVVLVLAGGLLTVTAWKGAELVFRYGLGVMALVEAEGPGHSHEHDNAENDSDDHESHKHESPEAAPAQEPAPDPPAGHDHGAHDHGSQAVDVPSDGPIFALNSFHAALNSGDEQTVMAVLSPDVLIFESGGAERSRAEYASHHMKSDMAFLAQMGHDEISQAASEQGDTAWIVTESRIYGRYKDKDIDIVSIETAILKRGEDGWKIEHLHWSSR
jgi:ketosteroid isomerase-like protein